jgi:hypothetical protein
MHTPPTLASAPTAASARLQGRGGRSPPLRRHRLHGQPSPRGAGQGRQRPQASSTTRALCQEGGPWVPRACARPAPLSQLAGPEGTPGSCCWFGCCSWDLARVQHPHSSSSSGWTLENAAEGSCSCHVLKQQQQHMRVLASLLCVQCWQGTFQHAPPPDACERFAVLWAACIHHLRPVPPLNFMHLTPPLLWPPAPICPTGLFPPRVQARVHRRVPGGGQHGGCGRV